MVQQEPEKPAVFIRTTRLMKFAASRLTVKTASSSILTSLKMCLFSRNLPVRFPLRNFWCISTFTRSCCLQDTRTRPRVSPRQLSLRIFRWKHNILSSSTKNPKPTRRFCDESILLKRLRRTALFNAPS